MPLPEDILQRIAARFRGEDVHEAVKILGAYRGAERDRIARCILFLSGRSLRSLRANVQKAQVDYRDIIYSAEYDGADRRVHDFTKSFDD